MGDQEEVVGEACAGAVDGGGGGAFVVVVCCSACDRRLGMRRAVSGWLFNVKVYCCTVYPTSSIYKSDHVLRISLIVTVIYLRRAIGPRSFTLSDSR